MRELDTLLDNYLERCYDTAPEEEKCAFEAVLELPDPELVAYFLQGRQAPSEAMARVVTRILGLPQA